jgi:anaerobic dimethyl sulfoxide reductase subunit A
MFWVGTRNPVNQMPYLKKWDEALTSDKVEFVLTHEQFMSATARYADIVLPSPTLFERDDVIASGDLKPYYGYQNKIIEPLGECKTHCEIARELAKRLGINDDFLNKTEREHAQDFAKTAGLDFEKWRKDGVSHVEVDTPYVSFKKQIDDLENNPFPTPSGKIEIYSEQLAAINDPNIPPIPKYIQIREGPKDLLSKKYPLQFISYHIKRRAHSQFELVPWLRELQPQVLTMNFADAKSRGIRDGDSVKIYNDRGIIIVPVKLTERIMPGVVAIPQGAWPILDENGVDRGGCCNTVTSNKRSPVGALVTNTVLVEVVKV